jgi:hypothetical protein
MMSDGVTQVTIDPTHGIEMEIKNFGANLVFEPQSFFSPRSEKEVLAILGRCRGRNIRTIGRLHSWSDAPRGDDVLLDLRHLNSVNIEERDGGVWATIQAGCQIKKVITELERRAKATLPSLGLITEQTIAGAISTGTHGSGKHSISHYIDEVTIATYDAATGEPVIRTINGGDELLGARCSLGCMGVILTVSLRCRTQYCVEEHVRLYRHCEDVLAAEEDYPLQHFFLVPFLWKFLTQHRREVVARRSLLAPVYALYWFFGIDLGLHLVLGVLTKVFRSRKLIRFFYRYVVPVTILRGWKVVDTSQKILTMEHELFRHIEIEVFVKRDQLVDMLRFVRQFVQYCDGQPDAFDETTWNQLAGHDASESLRAMLGDYTHHYPICVRKVLPDSTLVSMASGGEEPYYALSFISYNRLQDRDSFFRFANVLARTTAILFGARPHWGKVCPIDSQLADQLYPRLPEFRRVCDAMDSGGVFRNPWLKDVIFNDR